MQSVAIKISISGLSFSLLSLDLGEKLVRILLKSVLIPFKLVLGLSLPITTQRFFPLADGAVLSYEEKTNKPDPHIFEVLLQRYKLNAGELLYLDDNAENIRQAERLGIHGIVFHDVSCIKEAKGLLKEECHVKD